MVKVDHSLRQKYAERFIGKTVRVLTESDGSGYTERYIRATVPPQSLPGQFIDCIFAPEGVQKTYA